MEILGKLMGGTPRVKLMRLFLFHPGQDFDRKELSARSKLPSRVVRRELTFLLRLRFIRSGRCERYVQRKKGRTTVLKKIRLPGWHLNGEFSHTRPLRDLLIDSKFLDPRELVGRFKKSGRIKLLLISGVFLKEENSRLDLLIVGDALKRAAIERSLRNIESEIGKELRYVVLDTKEFNYRLDMYDKFVRDVLEYPHERLIERIPVDLGLRRQF